MDNRHPQGHARSRPVPQPQPGHLRWGALAGPSRAGPGMLHEGATNADLLAEIRAALGGLPTRGALYRVRFWQADHHPGFIGEFVGMGRDMVTGYPEPTLRFVIRNPVLAAAAADGSREHPFALWPIDIEHISRAEPADLERPMSYDVEGEPPARVPGRPRVQ